MGKDRLDEAYSVPDTQSTRIHTSTRRRRDPNVRSYYSTPELRSSMGRLQREWGVGESELTRWLLRHALVLLEKGKLKPPEIETIRKARLG